MPPLAGLPILVETMRGLRDRRGLVLGGAFLRERRIALDGTPAEFSRILVHEVAHFIWLRLGNGVRLDYETLLCGEQAARARGELGWSAEWRKAALSADDRAQRSRRWREYCCESFCDTAAWLYSGVARHPEFTLAGRWRSRRKAWFSAALDGRTLSI
ncbi:MAG: hypothetical protein ABI759_20485 [Candidatus Solibacter sp.]